ncbi:MAG: hypothetical protein WCI51_05710 [Lentisphaerota bacterium]
MRDSKKIQICFIGDFKGEISGNFCLVASDGDYVKAACLLDKYEDGNALTFWVREKHYCFWLANLAESLGLGEHVMQSEMTPRVVLASRWNVSLPGWLTDTMVVKNDLLEMKKTSFPAQSFTDTFLASRLSPEFASVNLSPDAVVKMVEIAVEKYKTISGDELLMKAINDKFESWIAGSPYHWTEYLCGQMRDNPAQLWDELTLFKLLSGYPEKALEFLVEPRHIPFLKSIPPSILKNLPLSPLAMEQAVNQINIICNEFINEINTAANFQAFTSKMSGYVQREFKAVESILERNCFPVGTEIIQSLKIKFANCNNLSKIELNTLDRFIVPRPPASPNTQGDWDAQKWLVWAADEYLKYRDWQQKYEHFDKNIEEYSAQFSDWYVENYVQVQKDSRFSLIHVLSGWKEKILPDNVSIILMIDCMPLNIWQYFDAAMKNIGLHRHLLDYRYTPLPTYTKQVKKRLLSGDWQQESENYSKIIEERAANDWKGRKTLYTSNVQELQGFKLDDDCVILMNYVSGDETLHSDHSTSGSSYDAEIINKYDKLAAAVGTLAQRVNHPRKFGIYVLTDHGATLILDAERKSLESGVVKKLFDDEHHRFAKVKEDDIAQVPENLWEMGYRFKSPFEDSKVTYFIPRGHNTVKHLKPNRTFTHGGATPEEVIVPFAVFRKAKVERQPLLNRFIGLKAQKLDIYIQRIQAIQMELQNLNSEKAEIVDIVIDNPACDLKSYTACAVPGMGTGMVEIKCIFPANAKDSSSLKMTIGYLIGGERNTIKTQVDVSFKSAMKSGMSLDDLLK